MMRKATWSMKTAREMMKEGAVLCIEITPTLNTKKDSFYLVRFINIFQCEAFLKTSYTNSKKNGLRKFRTIELAVNALMNDMLITNKNDPLLKIIE